MIFFRFFVFFFSLFISLNGFSQEVNDRTKNSVVVPGNNGVSDGSSRDIATLNFDYRIKGDDVIWKLVRVYNDNVKTYIQLSKDVVYNNVPAFIVDGGGLVNYRYVGNTYIVDQVFKKGLLIYGVGRDQKKVSILYDGYEWVVQC